MSQQRIANLELANAQGESKALLEGVQKTLGTLPNLIKVMANSPAVLKSYLDISGNLKKGTFNNQLQEQIALVVSQENTCDYCLSAHTAIGKMNKLDDTEIQKNRKGEATDAKVQAALQFAKVLVEKKGLVGHDDLKTVREAGYEEGQVLEIVLNVVATFLTNYINHVADTVVDFPSVKAEDLV